MKPTIPSAIHNSPPAGGVRSLASCLVLLLELAFVVSCSSHLVPPKHRNYDLEIVCAYDISTNPTLKVWHVDGTKPKLMEFISDPYSFPGIDLCLCDQRHHPDWKFCDEGGLMDLSTNNDVRNLIYKYFLDSNSISRIGVSFDQIMYPILTDCAPKAGALAVLYGFNRHHGDPAVLSTPVVYLVLVYDLIEGSFTLVDTLAQDLSSKNEFLTQPQFDYTGSEVYYTKRSQAIKFNWRTGVRELLGTTEVPIVADNDAGVLLFSPRTSTVRIMGDSERRLIFYSTEIGQPESAVRVDSNTFVVDFRDLQLRPDHQKIVLFDFQLGLEEVLFEAESGSLMRAKKIP